MPEPLPFAVIWIRLVDLPDVIHHWYEWARVAYDEISYWTEAPDV